MEAPPRPHRYYALREQTRERKGDKGDKDRAAPEAPAVGRASRGRCNLLLSAILPTRERRPVDRHPARKIKFYPFPVSE